MGRAVRRPSGRREGRASMTRVFISYRADDDSFATVHLDQRLAARFGAGNVFRDSRHLRPGADFEPKLWRNLAGSSVVVAVIGPRWLTGGGTDNRLLRPADFVRRELEFALELRLPIVPLLLGDVAMPAARDLPESLRNLVNHQFRRLHPRNAEATVQQFVDELDDAYGDQPPTRPGTVAVVLASAPPPAGLSNLVRKATADSGLAAALVEQTAVGVHVIQPDGAKAAAMAGDFVRVLTDALHGQPDLGRLRVALHFGDVAPTPDDTVLAARHLANEPLLDDVLRATPGARIALIASDDFYQTAVRPGRHGVDRSAFARVHIAGRDAWVQAPGFPHPRGLHAASEPSAPPVATGVTNNVETVHGDLVMGDKIGHDKNVYRSGR
ncbi:toll/interleukin-1 receptor domain-containing protein [Dactylosporangium vinaceum]|uniref:toll/interleukin-1 receptor domain-containing protein n=1 Tax=Dactylosporangium vinaceum TaxID=53362 RepID=UPI001CA999A9|nr:toll/interleukin-1 receptor domain-containing protein [Dactylosporangium vinaceum]UAB97615.1 toll/interleukin-1 receptor domain-containing protein [Dactylosporangium vinaceum]